MTTIADDFAQARADDAGAAERLVARIAYELGNSRFFGSAEKVEACANLLWVVWVDVRKHGLHRFPTVESMIAYYRYNPHILRNQAFPTRGSMPLWATLPGNERAISFPSDDPVGKVNPADERQMNPLDALERREWFDRCRALLNALPQPERDLVVSWAEGKVTLSQADRSKVFRIRKKLQQKMRPF
jgi:hypothetical protein